MTRPAFYALFAGKDDALIATYRHGTDLLLHLMESAYRAEPAWRDGARAALRVLLQVLAELPAFATTAVVEIDAAGPLARAERAELLRRFDRFFREAPSASALPMPEELVETVVGGIYATIYRYVAAGRVEQLPPCCRRSRTSPWCLRRPRGSSQRAGNPHPDGPSGCRLTGGG